MLNAILDRAVELKEMMKSPERVEKIAAHVARHFRENVEPMGFKAFLVAVDREACALYKQALDNHLLAAAADKEGAAKPYLLSNAERAEALATLYDDRQKTTANEGEPIARICGATAVGADERKAKRAAQRRPQLFDSADGPCRTRTYDPMIKSHLLYQLS